ncbi:hypothetical protein BLNAU_4746 [Blattamonas nauphoetae]|uniref:Uncharacterized protein n=1 Tax=Blattamonas nauphoetae TaxID=2049346 RepID=A0ABQ9Y8V8_9EUKA|nr:hypothetical protein BLNAU_4746 [Blattamonas nauphoetae]
MSPDNDITESLFKHTGGKEQRSFQMDGKATADLNNLDTTIESLFRARMIGLTKTATQRITLRHFGVDCVRVDLKTECRGGITMAPSSFNYKNPDKRLFKIVVLTAEYCPLNP